MFAGISKILLSAVEEPISSFLCLKTLNLPCQILSSDFELVYS